MTSHESIMTDAPQLMEVSRESDTSNVRIAIQGCGHGTLNDIYSSVSASCKARSWPSVDLLIIGGDFEALRNSADLQAMAVPLKYRHMGDFHEYYSGARTAPYLTLFIGGNHEASNYLYELYYGGWVAPNIYYMGAANVLRFGPLRIAGLSGIWKGGHYRTPHFERLPYSENYKRSIYHIRELDVRKLLQIRTQVDVGLSHDWPQGIEWCGDWKQLFQRKPHFEADARNGSLGSIAAKEVLGRLRPRYWFSAHMHTRFTAVVKHDMRHLKLESTMVQQPSQDINPDEIELGAGEPESGAPPANGTHIGNGIKNSDEIELDLSDTENDTLPPSMSLNNDTINTDEIQIDKGNNGQRQSTSKVETSISEDLRAQLPESFQRQSIPEKLEFPQDIQNSSTKFLALDKCLPNRDFLQLLKIAPPRQENGSRNRPFRLEYDKEWLAITRVFAKDLVLGEANAPVPRHKGEGAYRKRIQEEEIWVEENIASRDSMMVPDNFVMTAPVYDPLVGLNTNESPREYPNPQTSQFCSMLQMNNPFEMTEAEKSRMEAEIVRFQNKNPDSKRGQRGGYGHPFRGGRGEGGRGSRGRSRSRGRGGRY